MDEPRLEPQEIEEVGDHVILRIRVSGRGKATGMELSTQYFHAWSLRDGRPQCCVVRSSAAEALLVMGVAPLQVRPEGLDVTEPEPVPSRRTVRSQVPVTSPFTATLS